MRGKLATIAIRVCWVCSKNFATRIPNQKACNDCQKKRLQIWYHKKRFILCPSCGKPMFKKSKSKMCRACYKKYAVGEQSPAWRGGKRYLNGYVEVLCHGHHRAHKNGYVMEHIKVWEDFYAKPLPDGWIIHHLNGIKDDNRIENLLAVPRAEHSPSTLPHIILDAYKKRIRNLETQIKELAAQNHFLLPSS